MSKIIALRSTYHTTGLDAWNKFIPGIKQQALLFDQIGIFRLSMGYKILEKVYKPESSNIIESIMLELQWLQQMGIIFEQTLQELPMESFRNTSPRREFEEAKNLIEKAIEIQETIKLGKYAELADKIELRKEWHSISLRLMSVVLETSKGVTAVTTFPYTEYTRELPNSNKSDVAQIVISSLPLPDNETSWEKIIDYRNDPENQKSFLALRRWISKISRKDIPLTELQEEIEWLINEFQEHMKIHKMKANTETLEVLVKAPLEIIENLVRLKLSKIPGPFFALKKRQLMLMEAEMNAPGKELAYIIKSREAFQSQE